MRATQPRVVIEPSDVLVDRPVGVRVQGARPGSLVRLTATSVDADGVAHTAWADYETDAAGAVDPIRQAPLSGTYAGVDPFGLWWSMRSLQNRPFTGSLDPIPTAVSADADGERLARVEFNRLRVAPRVTVESVRHGGLTGTLFLPQRREPPGVVVLGGSEGGVSQAGQIAALLAARGFAAFALAYFGADGLPDHLVEIPIEYVERAIDGLSERVALTGSRIGLVGSSRGAELALLAASGCSRVGAVVAFAGSGVVWPGIGSDGAMRCAWTRNGHCLPYATPVDARDAAPQDGEPIALRGGFVRALDDGGSVAAASIPIERIAGPVFLISGGDDQMWPSDVFGELAMRRLASAHRPFADRHDSHPGAGHTVARPPALPTPTTIVHPRNGTRYAIGGTKAANARAAAAAWPQAVAFLERALGGP